MENKSNQSRTSAGGRKEEKTAKRRGNGNTVSSAQSPGSGTFKPDSHADLPVHFADRLGVYRWTW